MKICTCCGIHKPLNDFPRDSRSRYASLARTGQGVGPRCRFCVSESRKPGLKKERDERLYMGQSGFKVCGKCKEKKSFHDFHKRVASADGLSFKCKHCVNFDTATWRNRNPKAHAKWYEENKAHKADYFSEWREKNKATEHARMAIWAKANPDKINANVAKRNAVKLRAIPAWANHAEIGIIYANAAFLRKLTGKRYEVDHIVPLQGKTVCGLHWEGNLQILTEAENISKHNRWWPDMPVDTHALEIRHATA